MANIFQKILAARDVISAGESLSKPETWANNTALSGIFTVLIVAILKFVPSGESIDQHTIDNAAIGLAALYSLVSPFVHVATHKDAGLPPKRKSR